MTARSRARPVALLCPGGSAKLCKSHSVGASVTFTLLQLGLEHGSCTGCAVLLSKGRDGLGDLTHVHVEFYWFLGGGCRVQGLCA